MDNIKLNKNKFKTIILYILTKCDSIPSFGKTTLFKLLYFIDFNFYELYERSLSGERYIKAKNGPMPLHFKDVISEMKVDKEVKEYRVPCHDFTLIKYLPLSDPNLSKLKGDEIKLIDGVIDELSHLNARRISSFSHGDMPWKATGNREIIDYELVFYRDSTYSVREYNDEV